MEGNEGGERVRGAGWNKMGLRFRPQHILRIMLNDSYPLTTAYFCQCESASPCVTGLWGAKKLRDVQPQRLEDLLPQWTGVFVDLAPTCLPMACAREVMS